MSSPALLTIVLLSCDAAVAQERNQRSELLDRILSRIECCAEDQPFAKPPARANVRANLGIAIGEAGRDDTIHLGAAVRASDGKLALKDAYRLDATCRRVAVDGPALRPVVQLFTVDEIAARSPRIPPERLWPTVNATFQSVLLTMMKHQAPTARYTCLRRHLDRLIHGEPG